MSITYTYLYIVYICFQLDHLYSKSKSISLEIKLIVGYYVLLWVNGGLCYRNNTKKYNHIITLFVYYIEIEMNIDIEQRIYENLLNEIEIEFLLLFFFLSFLSNLGDPTPTVTWISNGKILQSTLVDYNFPLTINSKLVVRNLSRVHQRAVFTCQASNFHKQSVVTNTTIELFRKLSSYINPLQRNFLINLWLFSF